jgi:predicted transcriptional regulator
MSADIRLMHWPDRDREDYERLAAAISRVRAVAAQGRGEIVASMPSGPEEPDDADRARALLAQRRARDAAAGDLAELFGEPGWDILLVLFVAFEEGRPLRMAEIVTAFGLPLRVAKRWLDVLTMRGLVRVDTATDSASLTDEGVTLALRCIARA